MPIDWNTPIAGNSPLWWLLSVAWIVVAMTLTRILRPLLVKRLDALTEKTNTQWDDALVHAFAGTRALLIGAIAVFPVVTSLTLPARPERWLLDVATVGLFLQIALWAARFLDFWIKTSRDHALQSDPGTATGLAVMSFLARVALWSVLLLMLLDNLGFNVSTLVAGLGVGGIAVGFALQNILGDLFASLSIVLDKPFQIGHFVVIDGFSGTVENIGLKTTRIRSLSGEILVFANADVTKARLRNYKHMQERRILFGFGVTYDTPPEVLERIPELVAAVIGAQSQTRFDRAHFKEFGDSSLNFEVVYWMTVPDYTAYMDAQQAINLGLMRELAKRQVEFAFPTRTLQLQTTAPLRVRLDDAPMVAGG
jgi:small-conductance mechanosensitive channel